MKSIQISNPTGEPHFSGEVQISGAKNAAIPIIIAATLAQGRVTLERIPRVTDVFSTIELIREMGSDVRWENENTLVILPGIRRDAGILTRQHVRFSILALGIFFAKGIPAGIPMPGGCNIGERPIDIHLAVLQELGARIRTENGIALLEGIAKKTDEKRSIRLRLPSVGATFNAVFSCVLGVRQVTTIHNCAREPEVQDCCNFLVACGAQISGIGTGTLVVRGVETLGGCGYSIIDDRIEAATYTIAAVLCNSCLRVIYKNPPDITALTDLLTRIGATITISPAEIAIDPCSHLSCFEMNTGFYPGLATDIQPLLLPLALKIGNCRIVETIYEMRVNNIPELQKMGGDIQYTRREYLEISTRKSDLHAAEVTATDLRGGMSLVLAALGTRGTTTIRHAEEIDRGYERYEEKLQNIGVDLKILPG